MIVPDVVELFFSGTGGVNIMASPNFLKYHNGFTRIYLPAFHIYHGGRDINGNTVYTKYKILGKESKHNTIQGVLEMNIIEGYGLKNPEGGEIVEFIRPNDAKKLMTEGTTSIKRNSVIILSSGILVRLEDIENFCDLPIIERSRLFKSQTHLAVSKRETYKILKGTDNWAHVKRGALARDMERSVHKLLLPYYRKYREEDHGDRFFKTFMEDLITVCNAHHANFTENGDFCDVIDDTIKKSVKRKSPHLINETRPRKRWGSASQKDNPVNVKDEEEVEDRVKRALKNVSKSKIASIVF